MNNSRTRHRASAAMKSFNGCATSISMWCWSRPSGHNPSGERHMAKEGSVAPKERINVTFSPDTSGAQEELELPLKLMVLGDFTQREDERQIEDRKPISIDKHNFDEVLAKQELNLTLTVPNRLQDDPQQEDLAVKLQINSMKDFNPASLVEQVPELRQLMELRDALVALKGPLGNAPLSGTHARRARPRRHPASRCLLPTTPATTTPTALATSRQATDDSILDRIIAETRLSPEDEAYGIARRGVSAFIEELLKPHNQQ